MESALRVGRIVGISGKRGGGDAEALFSRPARAGVAGGRGWVAADGGGPALWDRPLEVYLWRQQARAEGLRCAKPQGGGRALGIDPAGERILRALVAERNDRTLDEYGAHLAERTGRPPVSRPTLCRALRRLGCGAKKDAAR